MELLIYIVGYTFLWVATDVGRSRESKIELFSRNWWLTLLLLTIGTYIIKNL